ncbi:hypothetical protein J6590_061190, partial [Homalodisca vitripennis]
DYSGKKLWADALKDDIFKELAQVQRHGTLKMVSIYIIECEQVVFVVAGIILIDNFTK